MQPRTRHSITCTRCQCRQGMDSEHLPLPSERALDAAESADSRSTVSSPRSPITAIGTFHAYTYSSVPSTVASPTLLSLSFIIHAHSRLCCERLRLSEILTTRQPSSTDGRCAADASTCGETSMYQGSHWYFGVGSRCCRSMCVTGGHGCRPGTGMPNRLRY